MKEEMERLKHLGEALESTARAQREMFAREYAAEQSPLEPDEQVKRYEDRRGI